MPSTKTINGACLCEKTTFEVSHEKDYKPPTMICHCKDCQTLAGGFNTYNIAFPLPSLKFTGQDPGKYDRAGDSGTVNTKVFCTSCGSSIITIASKRELAIVKVPSLKAKDLKGYDITPQYEQYTKSKFSIEPEKYAADANQFEEMKK